ncbi:accessory Sec system glycosyltransferase GtfA [Streptococcus uberis]|uniref:accessory Sec system glycosyltransferase GtfA n=1 Tax=Streptococcus uberis TaxID=1349 RepID=UPI0012B628AE|nr:accessory Sec system glycosyltransferase GtfA [Streptococcus uberis]MTB57704.1 accessory Sec system glycosyltransferase GtfA [Streptococcus uberis]
MTIYNINLGIGWASSGVEYAQAYRAELFRKLGIPAKFIFIDMFQTENLQHFTKNIGLEDDEVIWLYSSFTNIPIAESTYTLEALEASFGHKVAKVEENGKIRRYTFEGGDYYVNAALHDKEKGQVQRAEHVSKGQLIRKDYFSYTRLFSEFYAEKDGKPIPYLRTFYMEDGSIAYEEHIQEKDSIFVFQNRICYGKNELIAYFMERLQLVEEDLVLLDRATGIGQVIFETHGSAKLGVVIHAEHYNIKNTDQHNILWNNYYEYQFTHADLVDVFITSTEAQKATLEAQFRTYGSTNPKIVAIPVGSLDRLRQPKLGSRKPFSLVTASRLAAEKHIDWLVRAVIQAKKVLPDLQFHIYGEGGQRQLLQDMIEEYGAQDYIQLMGHHHLSDRYQQYELYLTASTSEGFGLTLMEAVGSGLPLIGLDVPYGNQTFIHSGQNGYLIPRKEPDNSEKMAKAFAHTLIEFYQKCNVEQAIEHSYAVAEDFLEEKLMTKWKTLVKELR